MTLDTTKGHTYAVVMKLVEGPEHKGHHFETLIVCFHMAGAKLPQTVKVACPSLGRG